MTVAENFFFRSDNCSDINLAGIFFFFFFMKKIIFLHFWFFIFSVCIVSYWFDPSYFDLLFVLMNEKC